MGDFFSMAFSMIVVLSVLVFFHELGHFLAAKISGIRVDAFSVGFPPKIFSRKYGETEYSLGLTPLGGYCKMAGMIDESLDPDGIKGEKWEFMSKPIPIRMFVLFAGPMANFLLSVVLFFVLALFIGIPTDVTIDPTSTIGSVSPGTPAEDAGFMRDDLIKSINGQEISTWEEMTEIIRTRPFETVSITIDRAGEIITEEVTIALEDNLTDASDQKVGMLGIGRKILETNIERLGFVESLVYSVDQTWYLTGLVATTIKQLIMGRESMKNLGGPLMIAKFADDSRKSGIASMIGFMAFLSLNLGFMNLLPIPVLDGGHLMILTAEGISRKELPIKIRMVIQQLGMFIILGLMVVIFYNDIMRFVS